MAHSVDLALNFFFLFFFLFCLFAEKPVDAVCIQEMVKVRQRLIEDYRINPDLMARCSDEIETYCKGLEPGGNTLHCLMKLARDRKQQKRIRDECKAQVTVNILHVYPLCFFACVYLIQQAVGPRKDLLTIVKRRKLQWYGHVSCSSDLAKTILQGTVKVGRRQGRQGKRWEDNIRE